MHLLRLLTVLALIAITGPAAAAPTITPAPVTIHERLADLEDLFTRAASTNRNLSDIFKFYGELQASAYFLGLSNGYAAAAMQMQAARAAFPPPSPDYAPSLSRNPQSTR